MEGFKVREWRVAAGLSQAELSRRSGITGPDISRYEAAGIRPHARTARRLADGLGISVYQLRQGPGRGPGTSLG